MPQPIGRDVRLRGRQQFQPQTCLHLGLPALARVEPATRLDEFRDYCKVNVVEASAQSWLGEAEGLEVRLAVVEDKPV